MEYFNNTLCVSGKELIRSQENPSGIISLPLWKKWQRSGVKVVRRACYSQPALIDFNTIPYEYRNKIAELLGVPEEQAVIKTFKDRIIADPKAIEFYSHYVLADGRHLPEQTQREYALNASVLNALKQVYNDMKNARQAAGASFTGFWVKATTGLNNLRAEIGHTLPSKQVPLSRKFTKYLNEGYSALISGKYCNDNSRKVSDDLQRLIMSLYAMPNKPFANQVHVLYHLFINGKVTVHDPKTGEIFEPKDFIKNDKPIEVSETTVWNYLNAPANRLTVDKVRMGAHRYNNTHRPHHHRKAPQFAFSKISMDDRDLPRKCVNGIWVKAYYSYDVASGCVIGYSHSLKKDETLFLDCLRDMFRLIERENFGMPLEVEVENHLVNKFFDDLAVMFPFVRICNPGNSQEKHAEHLNKAKKYGTEKNLQNGIGRWWSKHDAYTVDRDKINDEFVEKTFSYERLVADDVEAIKTYNNQLHPKQKLYPGKTRWQVLLENMNPNAPQISKAVVYKAVGYHTATSLRRNQYVTVRGAKYQIENLGALDRISAYNNGSVDAFYLPDNEGMIEEVFVYQNNSYVCKASKIIEYNTAKAEQTPQDVQAYQNQAKIVSAFDAQAKQGKKDLATVVITDNTVIKQAVEQQVEIINTPSITEDTVEQLIEASTEIDYAKQALENL